MFDEVVVCYKFIGDLMFYVTGSQDENELILHTILVAFYESVTLLLRCGWCLKTALTQPRPHTLHELAVCRGAVEKKTVLENLDLVLLAMDEIVDKG